MAEARNPSASYDDPAASGGLIDLSDVPLHELLRRDDDSVLADALRRVTANTSRHTRDAVSAFTSSIR